MTLPDATPEELLQEIALELAFAATGGKQSIVTILKALLQFQQGCDGYQNGALTQAIADLLGTLVPLETETVDVGNAELENIQKQYLALEKAYYADQSQAQEPTSTPNPVEKPG